MKTQLVIALLAGLAFVGMSPSAAAQGEADLACIGNVATTCANGAICVGNVGVPVLGPNYSCGGDICIANALSTCGDGYACMPATNLEWFASTDVGSDTMLCVSAICIGNVLTSCNAGICVANVLSTCNGPVCIGNVLTTCGTFYEVLEMLLQALASGEGASPDGLVAIADVVGAEVVG